MAQGSVIKNFQYLYNHVSNLFGLVCKTKEAKQWVKDNLECESWQWLGNTLWMDIRFADTIKDAIRTTF